MLVQTRKPGDTVADKYELIEEAGRGGMAVVWRANLCGHGNFSRTVALKQMHPYLAEQQVYVKMFEEEARIGSHLQDGNIAQVYDFLEDGGHYFIVMEWVEGIDLGSFVNYFVEQDIRPRWDLVAAIGIGVLRGLAAAHERVDGQGESCPIVHRDVSPHNVLLSVQGKVKLIDFGLSLAQDRTIERTEPGIVKGKISYLSPEVVAGSRPSPFSDQFATGSMLWESLVGRKLFDGKNDYDTYTKVRDAQVVPLRPLRPDVPRELVGVVQRSLAQQSSQRYPTVREMARELGAVLKGVRERKDLHEALGRTVLEARATMNMGRRTSDQASITPIFEPAENLAEVRETRRRRGLWHRLPFLGART